MRTHEKALAVSGVALPEALRHQHLNLMSEQFLAFVTEKLLHLRVQQNHPALLVNHHYCVGSGLQNLPELPFRPAKPRTCVTTKP